jgi:hypothetical protein
VPAAALAATTPFASTALTISNAALSVLGSTSSERHGQAVRDISAERHG